MASFIIGDYNYTILSDVTEASVRVNVVNSGKVSYNPIPSTVTDGVETYSVTDMYNCFRNCTSLTTPPTIPNSVTNMRNCFYNCTSLTTAPAIPDGVTDMSDCFGHCTLLTTPPTIPDSVTSMNGCFISCTSLTTPPTIPDSVTNMAYCFFNCISLTTAPVIPDSVTDMSFCFLGCESLGGDIYILKPSNLTAYTNMLYGTVLPITLYSYYNNAQSWANTATNDNVTVGGVVKPTLLNTQFVDVGKYRVDMLLDCTTSGSMTGIIPTYTLYDMNDNEIEFGVDIAFAPQFVRCYTMINATNHVPNTNISITIKNVAPTSSYQSVSIGIPSTVTPSVIKQQGETDIISPRIDVTNIRFNPKGTNLPYTVGGVIGINTTNMTKTQTNVDGDVKHIVTHADNVMIDANMTLQDWITEQYSYST